MINKSKKIILGVLILVLIVLIVTLIFIPNQTTHAVKQDTIRLGVILPLTGSYSSGIEPARNGFFMALEEINKNSKNKKVEIVLEDSKSEATGAITAYNKLVSVDNVQVVIGGYGSTEAAALAPIAQQNKIILFSPGSATFALNHAGDYVFKFREGIDVQGKKAAEVMSKLGYKKISIVFIDLEYTRDLIQRFPDIAKEKNIEILNIEKYSSKDTDFRTQLIKIKEKNPEAIYLLGNYQDSPLVIKQARELGLNQQIFSINTMEVPLLFELAGEQAEGIIFTSASFNCNFLIKGKTFCETYKEKYGKEPDYRAAFLYDSLMIVNNAAQKVGTDPEKMKFELLKTDYNGATGKTIFDAEGNAYRDVPVKIVRNGKFELYYY